MANVIGGLPRDFALRDVLEHKGRLQDAYPNNRFIEAKIRQTLQLLRNQGAIVFKGDGHYERVDAAPVLSTRLEPALAAAFRSASQAARQQIETWAEMNLYCLNCASDALRRLPPNTPVADFVCDGCAAHYQLKAKNGRFGGVLPGAAYGPTIEAIRANRMPAHLLVEYDTRYEMVVFVRAVRGSSIGEGRVQPRRPLRFTARRAGWVGCTIDVSNLASVRVVEPAGVERAVVRREWTDLR